MSDVVIRPVEGNKLMDEFIRVPRIIYQDCPQYVPDLDSDVRKLFDVRETPGLEFSDIQPFIAYRDGKLAGRVVGIVNRKANKRWETKNVACPASGCRRMGQNSWYGNDAGTLGNY